MIARHGFASFRPLCYNEPIEFYCGVTLTANLLDYIAWRGDLPLTSVPFGAVDAMILAQLSYIDFTGIAPSDVTPDGILLAQAAHALLSAPGADAHLGVMQEKNRSLLLAASRSIRFCTLRLCGVRSECDDALTLQFAAMTACLPDGSAAVCFRGTDNTLTGWKEDLNMSYMCPVPAQEMAAAYLSRVSHALSRPLHVLGHSKGGNLAVYAGAFTPDAVQAQVRDVYSFDGPGLPLERLRTDGYLAVRDRLRLFVPRTSIVGMLLAHDACFTVVRSDALLTHQHSLFSWQVLGAAPVAESEPDAASRYINETIDRWLETLPTEDRERFIDALFELLRASGATTLKELSSNLHAGAPAMAAAFARLDTPSRLVLVKGVKELASAALSVLPRPEKPA